MASYLYSSEKINAHLLHQADLYARQLPQSQGFRKEGNTLILTYIVDEEKPVIPSLYARQQVDYYAAAAYKAIFSAIDEIDLLLKDFRLRFAVLFWYKEELQDIEFTYYMNDLQLIVNQIAVANSVN